MIKTKIPKVIHYVWVGGKPLSEETKKYIETWKKYCPDYEIKEWNESNFDMNQNRYLKEAYEAKKYAFVADYMRLVILKNEGGIYLDTDVELTKNLDDILNCDCVLGYENNANLQSGFLAAKKNSEVMKFLVSYYNNRSFYLKNGKFDLTTNVINITAMLNHRYKLKFNNIMQLIEDKDCGEEIIIYPSSYFAAKDFTSGKITKTEDTYAIHHYAGTWLDGKSQFGQKIVRAIHKILGDKLFKRIFGVIVRSQIRARTRQLKKEGVFNQSSQIVLNTETVHL